MVGTFDYAENLILNLEKAIGNLWIVLIWNKQIDPPSDK